jgi:hypothetical protein
MSDKWMIRSNTYANCNCALNCGCQFNLPSTNGNCQFVGGGHIEDGYFNDISLAGLNWAWAINWPGEIAEGNGKQLVVIDERADSDQREALRKIVQGEAGAAGSNHFSVFGSTCSEQLDALYLPIEFDVDLAARTGRIKIPGLIETVGSPVINEMNGEEFHIALARTAGSFEFTYSELGQGNSSVQGAMALEIEAGYAQFCEIHYDQDGLVAAA